MGPVNLKNKKEFQEIVITAPKEFSIDVPELIRYKELIMSFVWKDIKVKYKQTLLGFLWVILQPLAMMTIFVVFFSKFLNIPTDNIPAPVFYFSGLILWQLFSSALNNTSNSMLSNAGVITKVYFPRLIIPISSVLVSLFDFLITSLIFLALILYYYFAFDDFSFSLVQLVLYFSLATIITCITSFGVGTFIASLNIKYRDFRFLVPFMIQFLMFVTPVIYPVSVLDNHQWLKYVFSINPMFSALNLARAPFVAVELDIYMLLISLVSMMLFFVLGIFVFKRTERFFADII